MLRFSKRTLALLATVALAAAASYAYVVLQSRLSEWEVIVVVDGRQRAFKLSELEALAQRLNITGVGPVKAVPLLKLLQLSGCPGSALVRSLKAVGADGYTVQLDNAFLHAAKAYAVLAENGSENWAPVRLVVEGLSRKFWVKQLVRLEAATGPWALALIVDNRVERVLSLDELRGLAESVEGLGEAVPLLKLLALAGVAPESVELAEFVGADGYRSAWSGSRLPEAYVLLVAEPEVDRYGPLRGAVVGLPKSAWVHHLVAVNVMVRG